MNVQDKFGDAGRKIGSTGSVPGHAIQGSGPVAEERLRVSALIDGELDDESVQKTIDALLASDDLARFWLDAHRAGDWMRSEEVIGVADGERFLRRFSVTLGDEPAIVAPKGMSTPRSRRFWIRTGLPGASIAAALLVVAWVATPLGRSDENRQVSASAAVPTVALVQVNGSGKELETIDPERLTDYLAAHRDVTPFAYRGPAARPAAFVQGAKSGLTTPP